MISDFFIVIGVINHVIDKPNVILIICDHIVFHIRISHCFLTQAIIQAANSGKLVHIQTIVNPIIVDDIQKFSAIDFAESTITSAHNASHITHQII